MKWRIDQPTDLQQLNAKLDKVLTVVQQEEMHPRIDAARVTRAEIKQQMPTAHKAGIREVTIDSQLAAKAKVSSVSSLSLSLEPPLSLSLAPSLSL